MTDAMAATRLHSEKRNPRPPRNHHAVTKRFEDFFNYALYEAPEKYKKTPAVVVAEAYTNSFMDAYKSCRSEVLGQLFKQEKTDSDSIKLLMDLQEEESNSGIVRKRDQSLFISEEKYYSLLKESGFLETVEPPEVTKEIILNVRAKLDVLEGTTEEGSDDSVNEELHKDASTAVEIAWDMLMLKPPAIACTPKKYTKAWHQEYGPLWDDRKPAESLVYLRPLLLYGAGGSVATKALVGNRSTNDIRGNSLKQIVTVCCSGLKNGFTKCCSGHVIAWLLTIMRLSSEQFAVMLPLSLVPRLRAWVQG